MVRPESWTRPAGGSPVWVIAGEPGSRPRFVVERRRAEQGVKSLFGGSKRAGRSATRRESCSLVNHVQKTVGELCAGKPLAQIERRMGNRARQSTAPLTTKEPKKSAMSASKTNWAPSMDPARMPEPRRNGYGSRSDAQRPPERTPHNDERRRHGASTGRHVGNAVDRPIEDAPCSGIANRVTPAYSALRSVHRRTERRARDHAMLC